ncbi:MAG: NAD-dependent epimerase/dehydratase family protein [Pseudomonadota bacterium]
MNASVTLGPDAQVLVTGATGFIGSELVRQLSATGARVRAIARPSSDRTELDRLGVEVVVGNVYDPAVVDKALLGVNYIFHVASGFREAGIPDEEHRRVNVDSTQLLARGAASLDGFARFVHVSTVGVHGHIENPPADESAPFAPGDIYQITKVEAEEWIRSFAAEKSLPLTVVRPAPVYGPGDLRLLKVFKFAKLRFVPLIGWSKGLFHLVHVEDLVRFMVLAASSDEALGEIFICGNVEPTSIKGMVRSVAEHLGTKPTFVRIPAAPVFLVARIVEALCKAVSIEPPIYPRRVAFFTKDRSFDTTKARSLPGFELHYDNESGIAMTVDWYREKGLL